MSTEASEEVMHVAETLRMLQEHLQCAICLETLKDPVRTRCDHTFCQQCLERSVKGKNTLCPLCNTRINRRGIMESEKIRSVVHAVHAMISSAKKDLAEMGYDDEILVQNTKKSSSKELSCSSEHGKPDVPLPADSMKKPSKRSSRVELWLKEVAPSRSTEESSPSVEGDSSNNEDSDLEMVSVSQINPDQSSANLAHSKKRKPLSAYIEEDDGNDENKIAKVKSATIKTNAKLLSSKKLGPPRIRTKHESLKSMFCQSNHLSRATPSSDTVIDGLSEVAVPNPVVVVLQGEKENATSLPPTRSPGWSRVQKMKKDFHKSSKVSRAVNSKGKKSPVPSIEDTGSGDELPCISLSLDSPVLRKKARIDELVNNLESEIQIFERSVQRKGSSTATMFRKPRVSKAVINHHIHLLSHENQVGSLKPIVPFIKLGPIISRKAPNVPIYLRGSLEHLHCVDFKHLSCRLLLDAETQTTQETPIHAKGNSTTQVALSSDSLREVPMSPNKCLTSPCAGSSGVLSDMDIDMDAETVLISQPVVRTNCMNENPFSLLPQQELAMGETDLMETEIVEIPSTMPGDTEDSQKSDSIIYSQNVRSSPVKKKNRVFEKNELFLKPKSVLSSQNSEKSQNHIHDLEITSLVPHVDLDSSASTDAGGESKKVVSLHSSSDSSDSEIGVPRKRSDKRKKKKQPVVSDNDSCDDDLNISVVDTLKIMANIEAQLEGTETSQSPEWYSAAKKQGEQQTSIASETAVDQLNISKPDVDSDEDCEFINPTPQKQMSLSSRSITQSDDIVESSQPPAENKKIPLTVVPDQNSRIEQDAGDSPVKTIAVASPTEPLALESCLDGKEKSLSETFVTASPASVVGVSEPVSTFNEVATIPFVTKPVFVCSSIASNLASQVEQLANVVGGKFSPTYTDNTTHLIVRVDESNRADKTFKYLCAVAAGKWIVSFAWVQQSLEAKRLLPEEPFEALDTSAEPGPRRSRESLTSKRLFSGFEFCCVGEFDGLPKIQLEGLLIQSGASIVAQPTDFSFKDHVIPITLVQWDDEKEQEYSTWLDRYSTPLVQHEWVLDCIGKFCVSSFALMILCEYTEDVLSSMGIPSYLFEYIDSDQ